jgi:CO dehydrogenase maturation factor
VKLSVAIAGKGGIGKTTLSALLVRAFQELGVRPVLAVDADPNSNLAEALGVHSGRPLAEIREQGSTAEGSPASGIGRARALDDEVQRALTEADGFDLITMGRPEGPRCYCYVNTLLRKSLDELSRNYAAVVIDNEAGMEHLSRRTTNDVDFLIALTDPTLPAIRAANRILALSRELPIRVGHRVVLVNRVGGEGMAPRIEQEIRQLPAPQLPQVPQDDEVERAGSMGQNVFHLSEQNPALVAVRNVVETLRDPLTVARERESAKT